MRWIAADFFARSPVLAGPVIALLLFLVVFTVTVIRAFRAPKAAHDRMADLPLEEDSRHE